MDTTSKLTNGLEQLTQRFGNEQQINVGDYERFGSLLVGGALAAYGISRSPGLVAALVGGALIYRGLSGHCSLYQAIGANTAAGAQAQGGARPSDIPQDKVLGPLDNPVDLASDDSFPASDPPAFNSFT